MRSIFNWIKKAVTFDSHVTVYGKLTSKSEFDCFDAAYFDKALNVSGRATITDQFETESTAHFMDNVTCDAGINAVSLPTSDPAIAGQIWNNSGVLNISSG